MTASQVAGDEARSLAARQNIGTILAVCAALDAALGRDWRNRDADAGEAITRLAEEAERRGAVKALRIEAMRGLEAVEAANQREGVFKDFAVHLMKGLSQELARRADVIESGEVTP